MKRTGTMLRLFALVIAAAAGAGCASKPRITAGRNEISGPYTHSNLAIFVVHGSDTLTGKSFLTMGEAMKQKTLVVYETEDVEELEVENKSTAEHVYIQSGEIVKGGKQDRTMKYDYIVPPQSGRQPIAAFCVDEGRWSRRGNERVDIFCEAGDLVMTKEMRVTAKHGGSQGEMWKKVAKAEHRMRLSAISNTSLNHDDIDDIFGEDDSESPKGLQEVIEHKKLQKLVEDYVEALSDVADHSADAVGFAFAVNGEIVGADVYGSRELFRKLWPKLMKAAAQEAFSELDNEKKFDHPTVHDVKAFLLDAQNGKAGERSISPGLTMTVHESDKALLFKVISKGAAASIHDSYHNKSGLQEPEQDADKDQEPDEESDDEAESEGEGEPEQQPEPSPGAE